MKLELSIKIKLRNNMTEFYMNTQVQAATDRSIESIFDFNKYKTTNIFKVFFYVFSLCDYYCIVHVMFYKILYEYIVKNYTHI